MKITLYSGPVLGLLAAGTTLFRGGGVRLNSSGANRWLPLSRMKRDAIAVHCPQRPSTASNTLSLGLLVSDHSKDCKVELRQRRDKLRQAMHKITSTVRADSPPRAPSNEESASMLPGP